MYSDKNDRNVLLFILLWVFENVNLIVCNWDVLPFKALVGLDPFFDPEADWGLEPPADGGLPDPGLDGGFVAELGLAAELGLSPVADALPDPGLADEGLDPSFDPIIVIERIIIQLASD